MFKILIADDEPFTRRCIIHALPWEENGFSVVASCKNGKEAFEALEEYLPDIVITDVRMPIMDGLDLLKKIQASYPHICVIIISGFEEFDYVKTAMDYGAYGYVLKPLNPDELLTVIKKAAASITDKRKLKELIITEKSILNSVLRGEYPSDRFLGHTDLIDSLENKYYTAALMSLNDSQYMLDAEIYFQAIKKHPGEFFFPNVNFQHVFLLCHEDIEKLSNYTERLHKALEHYLSGYTGYCVAVSLPHHGLMGILEGLNEASDTMNLRYIVSDNRIYYAGQEYNANYALFDDQIKEITSAVLYKDIHGSSTRLDTFLAKGQMNMYSTKDFANHLIYKLSNQIHSDEFKVQAASYAVKIYMSHEIPEVKSLLCSFLENCIKHLNKESQSNTAIILHTAMEYIEANLSDPNLSVADIAKHIHLNAAYFSTLFSNNCKTTVINHIIQKRMELAKVNLVGTNLKIAQIAEQSGYLNSTYFCQMFKKNTGISPLEYRNLNKVPLTPDTSPTESSPPTAPR